MGSSNMYKSVLFVCTGNICRSPTADGMLQQLLKKEGLEHIIVDSCGTHGWHEGAGPDPRAAQEAKERGYDISNIRSRPLRDSDFYEFDLIIAMDSGHFRALTSAKPHNSTSDIKMHSDFADNPEWVDVPDPYYGGKEHFSKAFDLIENGVMGILNTLKK